MERVLVELKMRWKIYEWADIDGTKYLNKEELVKELSYPYHGEEPSDAEVQEIVSRLDGGKLVILYEHEEEARVVKLSSPVRHIEEYDEFWNQDQINIYTEAKAEYERNKFDPYESYDVENAFQRHKRFMEDY